MNGLSLSPAPRQGFPLPSAAALCILTVSASASAVGIARAEPALLFMGAGFVAISAYAFVGVLIAAVGAKKIAPGLSCGITPGESFFGEEVALIPVVTHRRITLLPGIALRYELDVRTRDGRCFYAIFDLLSPRPEGLHHPAPGRGAYYGERDQLRCFDAFGLFSYRIVVPAETSVRLLVRPRSLEEFHVAEFRAGGSSQRVEPHYRKTEDLTEHRPYTPGDDPRRIKWKLYGHSGDLFVREGESEPPPRSRICILLDTTADAQIYGEEDARRAADTLAELALALTVDWTAQGRAIFLGFCGSPLQPADPAAASRILAYPAALSPLDCPALPLPDVGAGTLILALPRGEGWVGSLDRFIAALKSRDSGLAAIDLRFLAGDTAAETCVRRYGGIGGIRAHLVTP